MNEENQNNQAPADVPPTAEPTVPEAPEAGVPADETAATPEEDGLSSLRKYAEEKYGYEGESDADLASFLLGKLEETDKSNADVQAILDDYPELHAVILDLSEGKPLEVALAANLDLEDIKPQPDDADYESYAQAKQKRLDKKAEDASRKEAFAKNQEDSKQVIADFIAESGMDEEKAQAFAERIDNAIAQYNDGIVSKDFLKLFLDGENHEQDVQAAREQGEIDGKNAGVDAERIRAAAETDGMPEQGGSIEYTEPEDEDDGSVFSEIKRNSRKNW